MTLELETKPRDVDCPKCGAVAGTRCVSKTGGRQAYHGARKAKAASGEHVARNEETTGVRAWGLGMVRTYLLLPGDLLAQIPVDKGRRNAFIRDSIRLKLGGEADRWKRRYEHEREQRFLLERKLQLVREAAA